MEPSFSPNSLSTLRLIPLTIEESFDRWLLRARKATCPQQFGGALEIISTSLPPLSEHFFPPRESDFTRLKVLAQLVLCVADMAFKVTDQFKEGGENVPTDWGIVRREVAKIEVFLRRQLKEGLLWRGIPEGKVSLETKRDTRLLAWCAVTGWAAVSQHQADKERAYAFWTQNLESDIQNRLKSCASRSPRILAPAVRKTIELLIDQADRTNWEDVSGAYREAARVALEVYEEHIRCLSNEGKGRDMLRPLLSRMSQLQNLNASLPHGTRQVDRVANQIRALLANKGR